MRNRFRTTLLLAVAALSCLSAGAQETDPYASRRADWLRQAEALKPTLKRTVVKPEALVEIVSDSSAFQGVRAVRLSGPEPLDTLSLRRQSIVVDFGRHLTGYVSFSLKALNATPDAPLRLKLTFGEVPSEMTGSYDDYNGSLSRAWVQDEVVTVMTVPSQINLARRLAFRYVKIETIAAPNYDFCFSELTCNSVTSASATPPPLAATTDSLIREIDRIGLNTLSECMQTVYEDGPKRDQRLWIGDLYLEALANDVSFKQHDLTKRCLYLLAALADKNGCLTGTVFEAPEPHAQEKQFLLDYTLLYNVSLLNYLHTTADRSTVDDLWPVALRQTQNLIPLVQKDGMIDYRRAAAEWWVFIDWNDRLQREVALQGVGIFALKKTYELARELGRENEVKEFPKLIRRMTVAARRNFYDPQSGFFVGQLDPQVSCLSQVWATLSGIATPEQAQRALRGLHERTDVVWPGTPYAYHYYIEALIECGLGQDALTALTDYWGGMVRRGADTFWEAYDPKNDYLSPYNYYRINSYCHAWSCTPVYFIRHYPEIFQQETEKNTVQTHLRP